MLINKTGGMLVIGRLKIRAGEPVPGITLTAGEKKSVEAFVKAGYLVDDKPTTATPKPEAKQTEAPKPAATPKPKAAKAETPKPAATDSK